MKETKNVPQLRFSGFDDDWEVKKLGEVSDRVTRKNENLESTLSLTISAQYGLVDQITFFNNQVASTTNLRNYFLVKNGEFAYNKSYSAGYPWGAIKRLDRYEKGVLSTLYIVFKPKNINSDYLLSYYDTDKWYKQVSEIAAEGARNHGLLNIAPNDFFQTTFAAPMSEIEQQKIGTFLSHVDSLIQAKTKKLESLKAVKKSLLQKCFPKAGEKVPKMRFAGFSGEWEEKKLGEFCKLFGRIGFRGYTEKDLVKEGEGAITLSPSNIVDGIMNYSKCTYISWYKYEESPEIKINNGDILLVKTGSTFGKTALVTNLPCEATINPQFVVIKNIKIDNIFLSYLLSHDLIQNQINSTVVGGAIPTMSQEVIKNFNILIPSATKEQQKIGHFFSKYDSLISAQQKEIDKLKDIKKSLLQKMFV